MLFREIRRTNEYKKGMFYSGAHYLIGAIITIIVHSILGWEYPHAPPPSFFIIVLFSFIGFLWIIRNVINIKREKNKARNKGELTVHLIPAILFLLFILSIIMID